MMTAEISHAPTASPAQRSTWQSPVPYLFGGLAAMLGLIAFALLILACSYWKLSGVLDGGGDDSSGERDVELGEANRDDKLKIPPVMEEKVLVIMAGQEKPTFLATPISSRASSFGSNSSSGSEMSEKSEDDMSGSEMKLGSWDRVKTRIMETHETSNQIP